tara:strand:- start:20472 stop:20999 length:528 start_codon:yes stop_codon:yes gene_type:complete
MVVLFVLVALLLLMMTSREPFVEVMGFAGYKKPSRIEADNKFDYLGYTEQVAAVTATELQNMINLVQGYFKDDCVYPLETNSIKKFVKSNGENEPSVAYKCAFTFMTTKGFVYGFGVQADIVNGQLLGVRTQQLGGNSEIKPYTDEIANDFTEFEMITKKNLPTLEKLKAGEKSL